MPVVVVRPGDPPARLERGELDLVLVNNMPDGAFVRTETQLLGLLQAGSGTATVRVRRFSLPGISRSPVLAQRIAVEYFALADLWSSGAAAVLISGSEPQAEGLRDEPYWDELEHLLEWACERTTSALLSCLAAHAALQSFDGLERRLLPGKCSGSFPQRIRPHLLTEGVPAGVAIPHSRLNEVPIGDVHAHGYETPVASAETGWTIAAKERRGCLLTLVQGHPEYDATSLLREYRRDVRRFVTGTQPQPPVLPRACVATGDADALDHFHLRIVRGERGPDVLTSFPFDAAFRRVPWRWREAAMAIYTNWLTEVRRRSQPSPNATAGSSERVR